MGFDYALVHIKYTIPPAIALSLLYRPLLTRLDVYKILFLITIAVVSTIPWDSYLIRTRVWTYPQDVIIGPKLLDIPAEELFFFVIQTYTTSLIYLILNKATFHPVYLRPERRRDHPKGSANEQWRYYKTGGQLVLAVILRGALPLISKGNRGTYLGLIVGWAFPFLLLLWSLAYQFLIGLPWTQTVLPVVIPTIYLWIVDTLALQRGTWVIESGTKLGVHLWPGLEIEEALFFLVTNALIVFGLVAFDNALAVLYTFSPRPVPELPSPLLLVQALLKPASQYDGARISGLQDAITRLKRKSRSFYLASGAFQGKLRVDLVILYSFCRVADDLVDDADSVEEAKEWIKKLRRYLDLSYGNLEGEVGAYDFVEEHFPPRTRSAFRLLPTVSLSKEPLYDLLKGFEMDLAFMDTTNPTDFPIKAESDLDLYGARVAGTVAQLCLDLVFAHLPNYCNESAKHRILHAGADMGMALQFVNISRDVAVDAKMKRVYIPSEWLDEEHLTPEAIIKDPTGVSVNTLRQRMLDRAFGIYNQSKSVIEQLPEQARGPMRVAVESYMEIGRVLREGKYPIKHGRATVPKLRRVMVAWRALSG